MTQKSISVGQSSALSAFLTNFINEWMHAQPDKIKLFKQKAAVIYVYIGQIVTSAGLLSCGKEQVIFTCVRAVWA